MRKEAACAGKDRHMCREIMKKGNPLLQFMAGLALLAVGTYWFMSRVDVHTGFYSWHWGPFRTGGLVVVPFIIGVVWMFMNMDSLGAKLLAGCGLLVIIASVIMGTQFHFRSTNLYEYVIMLVCMFGGLGLVCKVLFAKPKDSDTVSAEEYEKLQKELERLKKNK